MKVLVPIKRVIDPYVKIRVKSDGSGVEDANVKMAMNPFDEIAVEEAVRLKEQQKISEIIVLSIGNDKVQETLRNGLALGADRALHINAINSLSSLQVAKIIKYFVEKEQINLVIMGKQAIDDDNNQAGQMLAGLLKWPQATFASKLELSDKQATVTREIDGGLETLALSLPAIVTTDLRLNTPRYASLPNIMKAKAKPLQTINLEELNIVSPSRIKITKVTTPIARQAGKMVENVEQLVKLLKTEAKVLE